MMRYLMLLLLTGCVSPEALQLESETGVGSKIGQGSACVCETRGCKSVSSGWYTGQAAIAAGRRSHSVSARRL